MLRRLYAWMLDHARRPTAQRWLALIVFIDASLFPVPPELLQIPMSLAHPPRALRYAAIGTLATAMGALLGYAIGATLFDTLGIELLRLAGREAEFARFAADAAAQPWLWGLGFLIAPMPAALAAGSVGLALPLTLAASVIGRGSRFLVVALLLHRYGAAAEALIDRYLHLLMAGVALLIGAFIMVRHAL